MRSISAALAIVTVLGSTGAAFAQPLAPTNKPAAPAASAKPPAPAASAKPPAAPAAKPADPKAAPKPAAPAPAKPPAPTGAAPAKPAAPVAAPTPAKVDFFANGEKKFKANDFAGALEDFRQVNLADLPKGTAEKRAPLLARYTAVCEDKTGQLRDAALHYDQFVAMAPKNMTKETDEAKKRSDEIKAMGGHIKFTANAEGAEITVDEKSIGKAPVEVDLPAGKHKVAASAAGRDPWTGELEVTYASTAAVNVELAVTPPPPPPAVAVAPPPAPATPPPPPAAPPPEPRSKLPAYITGGVAVAALGVGTVFGIKALGHQSDFDKTPTEDNANSGENSALIADMAFGVAITFGITSAVLFFTSDDAPAKAAKTPASPAMRAAAKKTPVTIIPTPVFNAHGGGAGALVRF